MPCRCRGGAPHRCAASLRTALLPAAASSLSALEAEPETTFSVTRTTPNVSIYTEVDQGVSIETLVDVSSPNLPDAKNALLTAIITVAGGAGRQAEDLRVR